MLPPFLIRYKGREIQRSWSHLVRLSGSATIRWTGLALLLLFAACSQAFAQYARIEMGWTGERGYFEGTSKSSEEPLRYYLSANRTREFLRAATDNCAIASACNENDVQVSQEEIGAVFGKHIVQVVYARKTKSDQEGSISRDEGSRSYWKSILAETTPGIYREIFLLKGEGAFWSWPPSPPAIVSAGDTKVLFTSDQTTSREMWCTGAFWVLEKSGPTPADFSAVRRTIAKALPQGTDVITPMCAAVHLEKEEVQVDVQKASADCNACGFEGSVSVKFKFEGARAVPLSSSFRKDRGN